MSAVEVATLLTEDGVESGQAYVVKSENGEIAYVTQETGEVFAETGLQMESYEDTGDEMHVYQEVSEEDESVQGGQDLVSLAMETSKVIPDAQEGLQESDMTDMDEDAPEEIECQLIQKQVYIGGQMQTIDFIMCNQCPRLFRTENLLWQHINLKHKSRNRYARRLSSNTSAEQFIRQARTGRSEEGQLEPGEIDKPVVSQSVAGGSPSKSTSPKSDAVFVVGLEKTGSRLGRPPNTPNRYPRIHTPRKHKDGIVGGPYKCPGCDGVAFSNRRSLELHMKRLHKAGIMECDECGRKVLDLKRHKEILHKRFKIFDCPHCNDKFCTQDDMERHLAKVEKNNMVSVGNKKQIIKPKPIEETAPINKKEEMKQPEAPVVEAADSTTTTTTTTNESSTNKADEKVEASKVVKEMESKTLSCSECGMKTHSRMTYIQHVLNGCIMDMVMGEVKDGDNSLGIRQPSKRGRKPGSGLGRGRGRPKKVEV